MPKARALARDTAGNRAETIGNCHHCSQAHLRYQSWLRVRFAVRHRPDLSAQDVDHQDRHTGIRYSVFTLSKPWWILKHIWDAANIHLSAILSECPGLIVVP